MEADLSPKAAARVAREAATHSFDDGARALNIDWGTTLDGKQIERWGEALGETLVKQRDQQLELFDHGQLPPCKENEHELLVIGMDGGRVQTRDKDEETGSRWKEDKVLTITSCLRGDGQEKPPVKLVSTCVATMTGLAFRRDISIASFWTSGTSSKGSSTPRSPRATITASKALMISRRFSTA